MQVFNPLRWQLLMVGLIYSVNEVLFKRSWQHLYLCLKSNSYICVGSYLETLFCSTNLWSVFITMPLQCNLKSDMTILLALIFLLSIDLAVHDIMYFNKNFKILLQRGFLILCWIWLSICLLWIWKMHMWQDIPVETKDHLATVSSLFPP